MPTVYFVGGPKDGEMADMTAAPRELVVSSLGPLPALWDLRATPASTVNVKKDVYTLVPMLDHENQLLVYQHRDTVGKGMLLAKVMDAYCSKSRRVPILVVTCRLSTFKHFTRNFSKAALDLFYVATREDSLRGFERATKFFVLPGPWSPDEGRLVYLVDVARGLGYKEISEAEALLIAQRT